jgi:cobalt-zinc-cadmium efflux system outer membrane protein
MKKALFFILPMLCAAAEPPSIRPDEAGKPSQVSAAKSRSVTFKNFLSEVASGNLDYAAERYNVSIAEAAVAAAKMFPNPTLDLGTNDDITLHGRQRMASSYGVGITQTIETGGKRKHRILGARQNHTAVAATLDDFLRQLRLDAAEAFVEALALTQSAKQKEESAAYLEQLAVRQQQRFSAGDISESEMLQARVEEQQFRNEVLAATAEAENASLLLSSFLGREHGSTRLIPVGALDIRARQFNLPRLLAEMVSKRPDLIALRHLRDAAQSNIQLEKANRIPDVDVGVGLTRNTSSQNTIAASPRYDSAGITFSLPLPLWNRNKAAIASAVSASQQAQKQLESAELKAEVQLRQAFSAYRNAEERMRHYRGGILGDAERVLEMQRFRYQRGESSLLEVLDAQRTTNDVRSSYNDALADHARALITLQRAAGIWDLSF